MRDDILQLYPPPSRELPLQGLYLSHNILEIAKVAQRPYVYGNFVASLDGRIAIPHLSGSGMTVPEKIGNPRDWRLFQELAAQAEILITSGRYLRDYSDTGGQEILQVYDDPQFADLGSWRIEHGLRPQPDIAVISRSCNFTIPELLTRGDRTVVVITDEQADLSRKSKLQAQSAKVLVAGKEGVDGLQMVGQLGELGYKTIYSAAGPKIMHLLLSTGVLDRLYLTFANRILGSEPFSSIVEGERLDPPSDLKTHTIYYDPHGLDGLGQLFTTYNVVR